MQRVETHHDTSKAPIRIRPECAGALLRRFVDGDRGAIEELFTMCRPLLLAHTRRTGLNAQDAEDVVQIAFEKLLGHARRLESPDAVLGWLLTVARRSAIELRRRSARSVLSTEFDEVGDAGVDTAELAVRRSFSASATCAVRAAVAQLDERDRHFIELMFAAPSPDYSHLSEALAMAVGSIGPTRARTLGKLRSKREILRLAS